MNLGTNDSAIRLHLALSLQASDRPRLQVTTGAMAASDLRETWQCFCENAIVPRAPWRTAEVEDGLKFENQDASWGSGTSIAVVRIDPAVIANFQSAGFADAADSAVYRQLLGDSRIAAAHATLVDYIAGRFTDSTDRLYVHGTWVGEPNLQSTSLDPSRGCYVGLHVDSWDMMPDAERHRARNRIAVNLGNGDRWLMFLGLSFQRIHAVVNAPPMSTHLPVRRFLTWFPDAPIFKLRIAPGEAYIAPTDNIVHDATTAGSDACDVSFTMRGDIRYRIEA